MVRPHLYVCNRYIKAASRSPFPGPNVGAGEPLLLQPFALRIDLREQLGDDKPVIRRRRASGRTPGPVRA